jgi:hypothetical protein
MEYIDEELESIVRVISFYQSITIPLAELKKELKDRIRSEKKKNNISTSTRLEIDSIVNINGKLYTISPELELIEKKYK